MTNEKYDKKGKIISLQQWVALMEDKEYKRVAETTVGRYWVSTVWLGLDHNWGGVKPLIFESMVFDKKTNESDLLTDRYSTLSQALVGHDNMVKKVGTFTFRYNQWLRKIPWR